MKDGEKIVFYGEGDATKSKRAGDLIFFIKTAQHSTFERDGPNLKIKMQITLLEALVGFSKKITHLDGKQHDISSQEIITEGKVQTFKGLGMPNFEGGYGDLFVQYTLVFPKSLTDEQKNNLKNIL
jgi:DnaJ family protein B protein 11